MKLLTVTAYAKREGVTRRTVWNWIQKGAVSVVRKGPRTGVRVVDDASSENRGNPSHNPITSASSLT